MPFRPKRRAAPSVVLALLAGLAAPVALPTAASAAVLDLGSPIAQDERIAEQPAPDAEQPAPDAEQPAPDAEQPAPDTEPLSPEAEHPAPEAEADVEADVDADADAPTAIASCTHPYTGGPVECPDYAGTKRSCSLPIFHNGGCGITVPFKIVVENRTSSAVAVGPRTSKNTNPASGKGSGFRLDATDGVPGFSTGTTYTVSPGSTGSWAAQLEVTTDGGKSHIWDARVNIDVSPAASPDQLSRATLTHDRQYFSYYPYSTHFVMRHDPKLSSIGDSLRITFVPSTGTGSFEREWRLIIEDAAAPMSATAATMTATRLTGDLSSTSGVHAHLKRPVHRIDVSDVTKRWQGRVPDRVRAEPSTVEALRGSTWEPLGRLDPNGTPTVDENAGTLSYGKSSFYFQDKPGASRSIPFPSDGSWFTLEDAGYALTAGPGGNLGVAPRTSTDNLTVTTAQQFRVGGHHPFMPEFVHIVARDLDANGNQQCVSFDTGNRPILEPCGSFLGGSYWIGTNRTGNSGTGIDEWWFDSLPGAALSRNGGTLTPGGPATIWRFTTTDPHPGVKDIRLTGGWHGTAHTSIWNRVAPSAAAAAGITGMVAKVQDGDPNSQTAATVVGNGLDADTVRIELSDGRTIAPTDPARGHLYDLLYFTDASGRLLTGLTQSDPDGTPRQDVKVSTVKPRHAAVALPGTFGVYVSSTLSANPIGGLGVNAVLAAGTGTPTSLLQQIGVTSTTEVATLVGTAGAVSVSVPHNGTTVMTALDDPVGSIYRDPAGVTTVMARSSATVKPSQVYDWSAFPELTSFASPVQRTGMFTAGGPTVTRPKDLSQPIEMTYTVVTANGTLVSGSVTAP